MDAPTNCKSLIFARTKDVESFLTVSNEWSAIAGTAEETNWLLANFTTPSEWCTQTTTNKITSAVVRMARLGGRVLIVKIVD